MIRLRPRFALALFPFAFAACATTHTAPPKADEAPVVAKPAPYKKPPLMLGRGEITSVSFEQFFEMQQSGTAMIFDARPGFFYNLGHIPGAIHLPKGNCDEAIHNREAEIKDALAGGKTLVVYCSGSNCPDARTVATHLSGFGFPVSVFSGGWDAWKAADMPSE